MQGPPACSVNTTKPWCLEDSEYPAYEISHAVEYNYAGVAALYKVSMASEPSFLQAFLPFKLSYLKSFPFFNLPFSKPFFLKAILPPSLPF